MDGYECLITERKLGVRKSEREGSEEGGLVVDIEELVCKTVMSLKRLGDELSGEQDL